MLALRRKGRPAQARDCQLNYPTPCGHIIAGIGTYGTVVRRARTAFYLFIFAVPIVPRGFSTCLETTYQLDREIIHCTNSNIGIALSFNFFAKHSLVS